MSRHRLSLVQRKTLVLDLDETLIHSHHDGLPRNPSIKPGTPHDFSVSINFCMHFTIISKHLESIRKEERRRKGIIRRLIIIQTHENFHLSTFLCSSFVSIAIMLMKCVIN